MEMPKPGPDQDRLKVMVGEWRGTEKMYPTEWLPTGGTRGAEISNRIGLDGFAVVQDYRQFDGETITFTGHAVILKNLRADGYQMYWFDCFSPSLFEGQWDGLKGSFVSKSPMGQTRATFDFSVEGVYKFAMEMSADGVAWAPMMDGDYRRV